MERYNYYEEVRNAVEEALVEDWEFNIKNDLQYDFQSDNFDRIEEYMIDNYIFGCDSDKVTGNASGSYFCNAWAAEESLAHNWDLMSYAFEEEWLEAGDPFDSPEKIDVLVRIYVAINNGALRRGIQDFIDEHSDWFEEEDDDGEDE